MTWREKVYKKLVRADDWVPINCLFTEIEQEIDMHKAHRRLVKSRRLTDEQADQIPTIEARWMLFRSALSLMCAQSDTADRGRNKFAPAARIRLPSVGVCERCGGNTYHPTYQTLTRARCHDCGLETVTRKKAPSLPIEPPQPSATVEAELSLAVPEADDGSVELQSGAAMFIRGGVKFLKWWRGSKP